MNDIEESLDNSIGNHCAKEWLEILYLRGYEIRIGRNSHTIGDSYRVRYNSKKVLNFLGLKLSIDSPKPFLSTVFMDTEIDALENLLNFSETCGIKIFTGNPSEEVSASEAISKSKNYSVSLEIIIS